MMRLAPLTLAAALAALPAVAQDDMSPAEQAHAVREAHMTLYAANIGPLVQMARGEIEFDADVAAVRAGNIAAYSSADIRPYFLEGSSSDDLEKSRALPKIWDNLDDIAADETALHEAALATVAAAGEGQQALAKSLGALGNACKDCHEEYRQPDD